MFSWTKDTSISLTVKYTTSGKSAGTFKFEVKFISVLTLKFFSVHGSSGERRVLIDLMGYLHLQYSTGMKTLSCS